MKVTFEVTKSRILTFHKIKLRLWLLKNIDKIGLQRNNDTLMGPQLFSLVFRGSSRNPIVLTEDQDLSGSEKLVQACLTFKRLMP